MPWFLYNVLFVLGYVLLLPRFLYRMWRRGGYRQGFGQRIGVYPAAIRERLRATDRVWVHAVSVGEVYVALRFIKACREAGPGMAFVLSTTTSTGHAIAQAQLPADDVLIYFPVDLPAVVRRSVDAVRPRAVVLTECELWPNLIREAHRRGIPVCLINGRISDSSFRGYRLVRGLFGRVSGMMDLLCAQGEEDAARLRALGAPADRIRVMGSVKYDMTDVASDTRPYIAGLLRAAGAGEGDRIVLGGSTWPGEELALLRACRDVRCRHPGTFLVLVPRHVERARQIEAELTRAGARFVLRSSIKPGSPAVQPRPEVLLVDTTGELRDFYANADAIFVGKSLYSHGGQNLIEPAA